MSRFDVIIIGSGLGGLECAQILSQEGMSVCVLEKNRQHGGLFQAFYRNGHTIDTSIHYVGSMDHGQILRQYFNYFGILESLNQYRLNENGFDHIHKRDSHNSFAMGYENFIESLCSQFPYEKKAITAYTELIRKVGDLSSVDVLKGGNFSLDGMSFFSQSAQNVIDQLTNNIKLREVLWGTSLLYAGDREVTPFYLHAITNNSNIQGAYRFKGGAHRVTDALCDQIRKNGGTIINNKEVTRIVVKNNILEGVMTSDNQMIESKYVISGIAPTSTLKLLDRNDLIKNAYYSRVNSNKSAYGLFCLYLIMKPEQFRYMNENHYINDGSFSNDYALLSMQVPLNNPEYAEVVTIVAPMNISELELWNDTSIEHRGESYLTFKEQKEEKLINSVSNYFPDLKGKIDRKYSATPLTFRDYTGVPEGSAYGIKKNYLEPHTTLISPKTKLPGLLLTGQNLNLHGVLGVTITSMLTCSEIIGKEYLAKKIGNL